MSALHRKESIINTDSKAKFVPKEHGLEELSKADGCWTSYLDFDGKRFLIYLSIFLLLKGIGTLRKQSPISLLISLIRPCLLIPILERISYIKR